ncbi:hypothetical protein CHS0354_003098 [Potamilus streckersoni]|uniref:Uncharacterized protein n=1 Tax=Potamilus streckersoni TaxID=2493646 RepID=A0AAE0RP48_9BIVA|nr:hypothetical protein CHS0354_003098 [Potamilus streckersoni]
MDKKKVKGVKYLDDCPKEPKLPVYLLVGGIFGTVKVTLLLCMQLQRLRGDDDDGIRDAGNLSTMGKMASTALTIFLFVWFAFGNYWLFRMGKPNYRPLLHEPRNWCEKTVHTFIFWQLVVCYVLLGSAFLVGVIFVCCFVCLKFAKSGVKG